MVVVYLYVCIIGTKDSIREPRMKNCMIKWPNSWRVEVRGRTCTFFVSVPTSVRISEKTVMTPVFLPKAIQLERLGRHAADEFFGTHVLPIDTSRSQTFFLRNCRNNYENATTPFSACQRFIIIINSFKLWSALSFNHRHKNQF